MRRMSDERIKFYKENYPRGTRVQLDSMGDDPHPIPSGTKGTVTAVDDVGTYEKLRIMESHNQTFGITPKLFANSFP